MMLNQLEEEFWKEVKIGALQMGIITNWKKH
jgi:hypothetical protein